jgi:hypothetical protein
MTVVNNIHEAVEEIQKQLNEKDYHLNNYRLLDSVSNYLDKCPDKDDEDFDQSEQIYNHLAYDLNWEEELFPMSL